MHEHAVALSGGGLPLDFLAFLTLGLLGSAAHCVGMCGPLVMLITGRYGQPHLGRSSAVATLWYSAGRVGTYACLGAIAGGFGGVLHTVGQAAGLQRLAALVAGLTLVTWGLIGATTTTRRARALTGWWSRLTHRLANRAPRHPITAGLLLGLLPCGLLWTAVVGALASGSALHGAVALIAFGLGTAPALFGVAMAQSFFDHHRTAMLRIAHRLVLVWGGWFLWRGVAP